MNLKKKNLLDSMSSEKQLRRYWSLLPVLLLILIIFLFGSLVGEKKDNVREERQRTLKTEDPGINVVTLKVTPHPIKDRINLPGRVEPYLDIKVSSEVQGKILRNHFNRGDRVSKGDVILSIDPKKYLFTFRAEKAAYEAALASKKRLESLYSKQFSNQSEIDNITAQVENLKARMENASLNLSNCNIKSPVPGILNDILFEEGEFVNYASTTAEIIQIDQVKIKVGIPESDISGVRHVESFRISVDALSGQTFDAKKTYIKKSTEQNVIVYTLELLTDNKDHILLPGMFARVEIIKKEIKNSISIPVYAVISNNHLDTVYVANNGSAELRNVTTGIQEGSRIQITEGLTEGDNVIITGQRNVTNGQKINIVRRINDLKELNQ